MANPKSKSRTKRHPFSRADQKPHSNVQRVLGANEYIVTHEVGPMQNGERLDAFLKVRYRRRSREKIKRAIEAGVITILRAHESARPLGKIKPSTPLLAKDQVQVTSRRHREPVVDFDYQILHEEESFIILVKPANLPVHPSGRFFFHTLLVHLKTAGFTLPLKAERTYFLVHRIDKETSGILVLAKNREAAAHLTRQFADRKTQKTYLAIVKGQFSEEYVENSHSMMRDPGSSIGLKMAEVPDETANAQSAKTGFQSLGTRKNATSGDEYSLVRCFPKTGRQHQIRVHLESLGHPIVGDKLYGIPETEAARLLDNARDFHLDPKSFEDDDAVDESASPEDDFGSDPDAFGNEVDPDVAEVAALDQHPPHPAFQVWISPEMQAKLILPRHALHAAGIGFLHPVTGKEIEFESDLPKDLKSFWESLI